MTPFALPDEEVRENHLERAIPKLGSLLITRDPNGHVRGLNEFEGEHPPVAPVFWSFRLMVGRFIIGYSALAYWIYRGKSSELSYD